MKEIKFTNYLVMMFTCILCAVLAFHVLEYSFNVQNIEMSKTMEKSNEVILVVKQSVETTVSFDYGSNIKSLELLKVTFREDTENRFTPINPVDT